MRKKNVLTTLVLVLIAISVIGYLFASIEFPFVSGSNKRGIISENYVDRKKDIVDSCLTKLSEVYQRNPDQEKQSVYEGTNFKHIGGYVLYVGEHRGRKINFFVSLLPVENSNTKISLRAVEFSDETMFYELSEKDKELCLRIYNSKVVAYVNKCAK